MQMNHSLSRVLRLVVFALLLVSTLAGLFLSDRLWTLWDTGQLPLWAPLAPPVLFFLFMVAFAIDRLHAVRNRSLPAHRALFHVGTSVVFLMLLLPHPNQDAARSPWGSRQPDGQSAPLQVAAPAQYLLHHNDAPVRAATCLLIGAQHRGKGRHKVPALLLELMSDRASNDASEPVRAACQAALARLAGGDPLPWPELVLPPTAGPDVGCEPEEFDGSGAEGEGCDDGSQGLPEREPAVIDL